MYRSFYLVVVLFLCSSPYIVTAQTNTAKNQSQVETNGSQANRVATTPSTIERSDRSENARKSYRQGLSFFETGELLPAVESFRAAIQFDPEFADAYSALGRTYFKLQEWQKAFDTLQRAAALSSKRREVNDATVKTASEQKGEASKSLVDSIAVQSKTPGAVPPANSRMDTPRLNTTLNKPVPKQEASLQNPQLSNRTATQAQPNHAAPFDSLTVSSETGLKKQSGASLPKASETRKAIKIAVGPPMPAVAAVGASQLTPTPSFKLVGVSEKFSDDPPRVEAAASTQASQPATTAVTLKATDSAAMVMPTAEISPTKIYRVGPNDVLDVRVNNIAGQESTLYTITPAGLLEYPMLGEPMLASGLTVDEIAAQMEKDLVKRAIADKPKAVVGVRDYASHSVLVSGLVKESGTKYLRREGIPLYVVIADAQPLPEAARVTVVRVDNQVREIDLDDAAEMNFLVRSGDVITLSPHTTQFVYIGGEIKVPGEKTYRRGLTLLQVVLASGGLSSKAKYAEIARVDDRGFLAPTRFQLKDIVSGNAVDPILKPGDRISILH